ncbi:CtsR family transcriptional regulator [Microaerobacter geothermalis]|uniref:CtsR family transcriptional regulator n=1 Tax=Microaerobacter geothermalis TaxID=674972 RepID=UPI001F3A03E0|nr:CtsR family transcriptional regulator [Microaerobacter geothermalis]MCF6095192.1 CtsR family transcriptional regulator [Microaerobacter geothermalis]
MRNVSDMIEKYLKDILMKSKEGYIEIQRSELAEQFNCVPSQINYVISTRFTIEKGYIVESKRGGGGYIRICRLETDDGNELYSTLMEHIGEGISQAAAEDIIDHMLYAKLVNLREAQIMKAAISRQILPFNMPVRDQIRANLLRAMVATIFRIS